MSVKYLMRKEVVPCILEREAQLEDSYSASLRTSEKRATSKKNISRLRKIKSIIYLATPAELLPFQTLNTTFA